RSPSRGSGAHPSAASEVVISARRGGLTSSRVATSARAGVVCHRVLARRRRRLGVTSGSGGAPLGGFALELGLLVGARGDFGRAPLRRAQARPDRPCRWRRAVLRGHLVLLGWLVALIVGAVE